MQATLGGPLLRQTALALGVREATMQARRRGGPRGARGASPGRCLAAGLVPARPPRCALGISAHPAARRCPRAAPPQCAALREASKAHRNLVDRLKGIVAQLTTATTQSRDVARCGGGSCGVQAPPATWLAGSPSALHLVGLIACLAAHRPIDPRGALPAPAPAPAGA